MSSAGSPSVSAAQRLQMTLDFCKLPLLVVARLFSPANKGRSWARAINDSMVRFMTTRRWEIHTFTSLFWPTGSTYVKWARKSKLEVLSDDVGAGGKLHWVGPRRYDRVLLYFHGGGYSLPVNDQTQLGLLLALQRELEKSGGAGIAFLEYSLTPDYPFPTQLNQANAAISHLLEKGLSPSKLILSGDSAGGNLVFQVFSHTLHPFPSAPAPPTLSAPYGGALLISPWVTFDATTPSFAENDKKDVLSSAFYSFLAEQVTSGLPSGARVYAEPYTADAAWWDGLDGVVARVFATAGEVECPRDAIVELLSGPIKARVPDTTVVVEKNGVHEDVLNAFASGEGEKSVEYWMMVKWATEVFDK
ncbi:alpha/beta-hydrolase [Auriscalpium vulgare]|uniref:Alpha/beta-hydrolase n=1 Tax=Auriscalpium vulgare TaxID=40419 RepID=A0ACB8RUM7_9AGAM|nr:alpha/beta-hydrolase [Auriscalpium vulgare]